MRDGHGSLVLPHLTWLTCYTIWVDWAGRRVGFEGRLNFWVSQVNVSSLGVGDPGGLTADDRLGRQPRTGGGRTCARDVTPTLSNSMVVNQMSVGVQVEMASCK
ncbi:hypothetical protein VTK26DRAFT_3636 [Humicola hyalothermophila]